MWVWGNEFSNKVMAEISGASDFVLGGSTNGWTEWKNSEDKTLNDLYRKE